MNEKEKWLLEHLNSKPDFEEGEKRCIDSLNDAHTAENDASSCIDVLESLLSLNALPLLVTVMKDNERSLALRKQAAIAISVIGSDYVQTELMTLFYSPETDLRMLSGIALQKVPQTAL